MIINIPGYDINELLYESSNSLVYRAERQSDKQAVIVKMLSSDYPSPEKIAWFKREYEVTHNLNLAGVPSVYSYERHQNRWLIVQEDFGGDSLRRLKLAGSLELTDFLRLAIKVSEILAQLHAKDIMHKDINPANIVLNPTTEEVKLIDFGISTILSRENLTTGVKNPSLLEGTLKYISPEQTGRMNRSVDYRTDFYSLGVTFYELLTGQLPFVSDDPLELVHSQLAKQPLPPHDLRADIPRPISSLVLKLMAKNADERYQSAQGLKADLEECLRQSVMGTIMPFALGQQEINDRFQLPAKLYGRAPQIKSLLDAFGRVSTGASEMMLVAGYSGIGKSALVQEVYQPVTESRGYYLAGKFEQFQRDIPYAAFIQAFRSLMRQLLTESDADIARWREKLKHAVGSLGQVISRVIPEVDLIIGLQPDVPELTPRQAQSRFNQVFQEFIKVFAQAEHPLVLFLDDLQWADRASVKLINLLMTGSGSDASEEKSLFLIGAYRDNEVSEGHPLMLTLDEMKKNAAKGNHLTLCPLQLPDVTQLIADTLHIACERAHPLAKLVHTKTGGNPFFLREFLKSLYSQKLLTFDYQGGVWQWELAQIQAEEITDNVVELMAGKVKQLPQQTQAVLKLAACIGNQFDSQTLALAYQKSTAETAAKLWPAMREGLLLPLSDAYKVVELEITDPSFLGTALPFTVEYKFVHDRVQQAVYSLLSEADKQTIHLELGRLLFNHTSTDMLDTRLFDLVNHWNQGRDLIDSQAERLQLAQLNLQVGKKAKASAAIEPALNYLNVGITLLRDEHWPKQYDLMLALYVEAAKAAYLCGHFEQMERLTDSVLSKAKTLLDKVKAIEVRIDAYYAQNRLLEVIETTRQILSLLGLTFPEVPSQLDVEQAFSETEAALAGKPTRAFTFLPEMTDPEKIATIRLLQKATHASFMASPNLHSLFTLKMVNLSLQYGFSSESCVAFGNYGVMLCTVVSDIERGYQFGQLALRVAERLGFQDIQPLLMYGFGSYIIHWKRHLRETLPFLRESYQSSLATGDFGLAAPALQAHTFAHSYYAGKELTALELEMVKHHQVITQLQQVHARHTAEQYLQLTLNLTGRTESPSLLRGQIYDAEKMLPIHHQANNKTAIFGLHLQSLFLRYLFEEYKQAAHHTILAAEYLENVLGSVRYTVFHFYESLVWLAVYSAAEEAEQLKLLEKVTTNQEKLEDWATHAPMNQQHKYYLVEAERAHVLGEDGKAWEYYDKAIDLAHENEYINEEALAYELAAKFYFAKGRTQVAHLYLRNAHYAYQRWGALSKVEQMEEKYPFLTQVSRVDATVTSSIITSTGTRASTTLDIESVLKANQAIAGEIHLAALLEKMIKIVIENAGAERGLLILEKEGQWVIEAEGNVESTDQTLLQGLSQGTREQPISSDLLPLSIVNYVARTAEYVVLNDATDSSEFTFDPYIVTKQPQSILCMPLLNQGRLSAILYLENNLTTGAFTPERLQVLSLLSSQAAISLENATLYDTLEQKVVERTREVEEARAVAESANQAKSTFLAHMSHELRSPLNAILGFSQIMRRSQTLAKDQVEHLGIISRSGEHLLTLINNVLDLSKIEAGKIILNQQNFDLYRLLDDVHDMFQIAAFDKGLQLQLAYRPSLPRYVSTDSVKLRQVLINLLSNAIKFTERGNIMVRVRAQEAHHGATALCFEVEDTGAGIAPHELSQLFEAFVQTERGKNKQEGTGLGLPISRQFVRLMGGEMNVTSQVGRGTTFTFDIQVTIVEASQSEEAEPTREVIALAPNQPPYRILIVDDKWTNRHLLINLLEPVGFALEEASNGEEAIGRWRTWQPHLIWMDMRMPIMDGYQATKHIKKSSQGVACPIIALTASIYEEEQLAILDAGCDDFLRKPFASSQIFQLMKKHLGVRYLYEEESPEPQYPEQAQEQRLSPATLSTLPAKWRHSFHQATIDLNLRLMQAHLEQIRSQNEPLADALAELVNSFQFEKLSALLEEAET